MNISRVGVVGLGKMGLPMARHILERGYSVMGFDRHEAAIARFMEAGGKRAKSCAEIASASDLVIIVVGFESQVEETLFGPAGLIEGVKEPLIVAVASTVAPSFMKYLSGRVADRPVTLLDTPVTRAEQAAESGTLLLLGGGDAAAFDRCRAVFGAFASDVEHIGALGAGQVAKMLNNLILWTCTAVNYEALKFAAKLGVDPEVLRAALAKSTAQNWPMTSRSDERSAPWAEKDMMVLLREADIARVSLPVAGVVKEAIKAFKIERGHPLPKED